MAKELFVITGWYEHGDAESGPMVTTWHELVEAENAGEVWLKYRSDARVATNKEQKGYEAYKREVQKFKELGIEEDDCPFGMCDFVDFEEI